MEDRIEYSERMLADNPTGLLALANGYNERPVATKTKQRSSSATW